MTLADLPPEAATALAEVLADPALGYDEMAPRLKLAFDAVGWPPASAPIPEAAALTPGQRALAEALAERALVPIHAYAIPFDRWSRRRWLGLDPPGALEQGGLWQALTAAAPEQRTALLCALPVPARVAAVVELALGAYRLSSGLALTPPWLDAACTVDDLDQSGASWAPALADFLIACGSSPDWHKSRGPLPPLARWLVFGALLRAGVAIEPRWDRLLPLARGPLFATTLACIRALPPARQVPAVRAALAGVHPAEAVELVLELLRELPSPELVALFDDCVASGGGRPRDVLRQALAAAAREVPALAAAMVGRAPDPPVRALALRKLLRPQRGRLPRVLKQQLAAWVDDDERWSYLEVFAVSEKRKRVYDMFLFSGDDGTVFKTGTTTEVARFSQGSPDTTDAALAEALANALYQFRFPKKKKR